jgi:diaminopimelate epimerase
MERKNRWGGEMSKKFINFVPMNEVRFTKMHGIGNDYIYITEMPCTPEQLPQLSRLMSDRHCGVGGDGIILILPSEVADFKMRIFNADGSEAKMCGNGSRCVGKYVYDHGMTHKTVITLETLSGIKTLTLHPGADGKIETVTVDMGCAVVSEPLTLATSAGDVTVVPVDMGNPHAVMFIDCDPDNFDVHGLGRELEMNPVWPDRANIEFAQVIADGAIKMRVWERGSGETMACGTGACATAAAALATGRSGPRSVISLPGGDLTIELHRDDCRVMMTGSATTVFYGTYKYSKL